MSAQHTPGPWRYVPITTGSGGSDPVYMVSYHIYAQGYKRGHTFDYPCLGTLNGAAASEADAALIAASPDLLKAAREILEWMYQINTNIPTMSLRTRLRNAVAKAEGQP